MKDVVRNPRSHLRPTPSACGWGLTGTPAGPGGRTAVSALALALALATAIPLGAETAHAADAPRPAKAPHGEVTIYRDAKGVPHIYGETSAAVMYGLGYAMAHDRLVQMEINRRAGLGRRAEVLGPSFIRADKTNRDRALAPSELMRMYATLPAEHQLMMQSFVDGLNKYIDEVNADPAHLTPYEFVQWGTKPEHWALTDYLAYIASIPSGRGGSELQNLALLKALKAKYGEATAWQMFNDLVPISDPDSPTTIPAGEDLAPARPIPQPVEARGHEFTAGPVAVSLLEGPDPNVHHEASRCFVVGPNKSASGHVLMMESTGDGPEADLHGGGFDTAGFSFPGWGPAFMGRGGDHGFLMTSGIADGTTTFAERLNPKNKYQYWFKGAWKDMEHHTETILVKGAAPVTYEVAHTVHGPVTTWDVENGAAYTQAYAERGHELDNWVGILELGRAKSMAEFQAKGVARITWNVGVCYGDASGQIGFWEAGMIPKRAPGTDTRLPTPGTGEFEWTGFLSADEHPHMVNPKEGYIHTWNSKATTWSAEGNEAHIGKTFHTWLGHELAQSHDAVTLLDLREFNRKIFNGMGGRDHNNTSPQFFAKYVRAAVAKTDDAEVKQAAELMLSFNGLYEDLDHDGKYDSPGMPIFRKWLEIAPDIIFNPSLGDLGPRVAKKDLLKPRTALLLRAVQGPDAGLPIKYDYLRGRDRDALIVETLRATIDQLKPQFKGQDMAEWRQPVFWRYYDLSRMTPDKPMLPGNEGEPRLSAKLGLGPYAVPENGGEEWSVLMELNPKQAGLYTVVYAGGQDLFIDPAGHGNPNLADQTLMHANNEFKHIAMAPDEVKRDAVSVIHLAY
jgi:penicillin G amidase